MVLLMLLMVLLLLLEARDNSRHDRNLSHRVDALPDAILLDLGSLSGSQLLTAAARWHKGSRHLKAPLLEQPHLDLVQQNKVNERDAEHNNRLSCGNLGSQTTKDNHQQRNDLGANNHDSKQRRGQVLPEVASQTGREDHKVGRRRDVKVHDRLEAALISGSITLDRRVPENLPEDEEMSERQCSQANSQHNRHCNQLANSPLVRVPRDLGVVDRDNKGGEIVQDANKNEQVGGERPIIGHNDDKEEHQKVDSRGDSVQGIGTHALEDGTGSVGRLYY